VQKRKLIEVSLPLEAINRESAREKSIRHGHPSTMHLWWARRPLAAARAVLFAQLVDDPSARPEEFPTQTDQRRERERLHALIERLVVWENVSDKTLLASAHAEIMKSTGDNPPPILDPFAGGGAIPLEAQRLGLEAQASDLNPVAVLINKALVEIPPKVHDRSPVSPGLRDTRSHWNGTDGIAADVLAYGQWMLDEAELRIGHLYPKATLPDGSEAVVISWIWARTVICPNPACAIEMPLVRSWWLGKKKGKEAYLIPSVVPDPQHLSGRRVEFSIGHGHQNGPTLTNDGTVTRTGAVCLACQNAVPLAYVRAQGKAGRIGATLMAIVTEGNRRRVYLPACEAHVTAAHVSAPADLPPGDLPAKALGFRVGEYGMKRFTDLFTNRQLVAMATLSDLVGEARTQVLNNGGDIGYANAVATYLGMTVSRQADLGNSLCRWEPNAECPRQLFGRQAISMVWDFAESNPLGSASGSWRVLNDGTRRAFASNAFSRGDVPSGTIQQSDAATRGYAGAVISTDPPYYDNIGYSDLSDFFFIWLRRSLGRFYPELFSTILVPKDDELVANPFRHNGKEGAERFFEDGFRRIFAHARKFAHDDFPVTVYYAFKQSDSDDGGEASTGWERLLEGMIRSGWSITSTWPIRSETAGRLRSHDSNALASSIVLSLRPRQDGAPITDRRGFIAALEAELPDALRKLQQGQIAPVDLPQAAIGPGMAVYSRYEGILEPDGAKMTVRSALTRINEILDQVLNEQEGDFDSTTRFAIAWYRQHGYSVGKFGDADNLARARNTSVDLLDRDGILTSRAGKVQLIRAGDLGWDYSVSKDSHTSTWEALHHLIKVLERDGITPAGDFLKAALARPDGAINADLLKELAHLLFRIAQSNSVTRDALSFNAVVSSWPETLDVARSTAKMEDEQGAFDFDEES